MQLGLEWLARAASGEVFSRFHAEAGIAAEHCFAPSFAETRWKEIAELYAMLERIAPSPLHTLNRAVAVAEWQGPEAGLALLEGLAPPAWLAGSYLWDAVLGDLHRRAGNAEVARRHRERALALGAHGGRAGPAPAPPDAPRVSNRVTRRASVLSRKSACIRPRLRPARCVARRLHTFGYAHSSRLAIGPQSRPRCDGAFPTQDTSATVGMYFQPESRCYGARRI